VIVGNGHDGPVARGRSLIAAALGVFVAACAASPDRAPTPPDGAVPAMTGASQAPVVVIESTTEAPTIDEPTTAAPTTSAPTTAAPTTSTPTTAAAGPFRAVATRRAVFDDAARARSLPVTVYAPAAGTDPAAGVAAGPFPLVLFAHGYLLPGDGYERVLQAIAARGYVVVAPEFPHTSAHGGDGLRADLTNQPADLSFVADRIVELGASPAAADRLTPPIAHPDRIAVVGHSDGGLTATAIGYGQQFRDRRVAAVISLTGGIGLFPGPFLAEGDPPPVLAVHARDDGTNPWSASAGLFRAVPPGRARYLLTIGAGGHIDPYMYGTGRPELGEAVAAFLDATLGADPAAAARLVEITGRYPDLSLEVG
jgi:dienelactone hydrolase